MKARDVKGSFDVLKPREFFIKSDKEKVLHVVKSQEFKPNILKIA
jgi:hypothetical protein